MRLSSRGVAILAAVLAAAAIGVGFWRLEAPSTAVSTPATSTTLEQVRDMLRQRATRLSAGDVEGYLKPLSEQARAVEEPIARGALSMPLAEIDLVLNPPIDVSENAPSFQNVPVNLLFRYKDLPGNNIFRLTLTCTIEQRSGSWMVTASAIETSQPGDFVPLWATGPTQVTRSAHFLVLSRTGTARVQDAVDLAEGAWSRLSAKLPLELDPIQLIELVADHDQIEEISDHGIPEGVLGYAYGEYDQTGTKVMRHVVIDLSTLFGPGSISEHPETQEFDPITVFQHELGHLALERYDAPAIPSWVQEAAAMYLSGERRTRAWADGQKAGAWDKVSFLNIETHRSLPGALYPFVNAAGLYLVQTFGQDRFFNFYKGYQTQPGDEPTNTLLLRFFGIDKSQLGMRTREYIRSAVGAG